MNPETRVSQYIKAHKEGTKYKIQNIKDKNKSKFQLEEWLALHHFPLPRQGGNLDTTTYDVLVKTNITKVGIRTNDSVLGPDIILNFIRRLLL